MGNIVTGYQNSLRLPSCGNVIIQMRKPLRSFRSGSNRSKNQRFISKFLPRIMETVKTF